MSVYYTPPGTPKTRSPLSSQEIRDNFGALDAAFNLLPPPVAGGDQGFDGGTFNNTTLHNCTLLSCILGTAVNPSTGVLNAITLGKNTQAPAGVGNMVLYRDLTGITRFMDNATTAFLIDETLNVVPGNGVTELSTASVNGFQYIPTVNGTSTGIPAHAYAAAVPMVFNRATFKIGVYVGGAWKYTAVLT